MLDRGLQYKREAPVLRNTVTHRDRFGGADANCS